jgi:hypothetical protein
MSELGFDLTGSHIEAYAAAPTLVFRLKIAAARGAPIAAVLLRCQIQIEPRRRQYRPAEADRLYDLFGERQRWGDTLQSVLWGHTSLMVPSFRETMEIDLPLACTYDLEVAATKYFHALEDGEIPLRFFFSGSIFTQGESGITVAPVPWTKEASYGLPVRVWRELMNQYFPGGGWLRLRRENIDALLRFKNQRGLATWDDTVEALVKEAAPMTHSVSGDDKGLPMAGNRLVP